MESDVQVIALGFVVAKETRRTLPRFEKGEIFVYGKEYGVGYYVLSPMVVIDGMLKRGLSIRVSEHDFCRVFRKAGKPDLLKLVIMAL